MFYDALLVSLCPLLWHSVALRGLKAPGSKESSRFEAFQKMCVRSGTFWQRSL